MKENNLSLIEAYHRVKSKRVFVEPNPAFMQQLVDYERELNLARCDLCRLEKRTDHFTQYDTS